MRMQTSWPPAATSTIPQQTLDNRPWITTMCRDWDPTTHTQARDRVNCPPTTPRDTTSCRRDLKKGLLGFTMHRGRRRSSRLTTRRGSSRSWRKNSRKKQQSLRAISKRRRRGFTSSGRRKKSTARVWPRRRCLRKTGSTGWKSFLNNSCCHLKKRPR